MRKREIAVYSLRNTKRERYGGEEETSNDKSIEYAISKSKLMVRR